jgi:hypothetical protein
MRSAGKFCSNYGLAKRGVRTFPARCDIDPVELPPEMLPNIAIVAIEH